MLGQRQSVKELFRGSHFDVAISMVIIFPVCLRIQGFQSCNSFQAGENLAPRLRASINIALEGIECMRKFIFFRYQRSCSYRSEV